MIFFESDYFSIDNFNPFQKKKFMTTAGNKTIAKNTMFLYFRMLVTMVISLYTSRVVLQVLGVDDYGIYQAVGGIVGFLSLINGSLSTGTSRFMTYGLGEGNLKKLERIFTTTLTGHIIIALVIIIITETLGLWFLLNKMIIPSDRLNAALWVFHLSVLTAFFSLTQIPFNACIIAHEKMSVYAYVSVAEAVLKLLIVYFLTIGNIDKLKLYALLLCLLQICIILFYRFYSVHHFQEARFRFSLDKKLLKEITGFSGWSLFASGSIALNNQGILLLLNSFFSPAVVSARAISIQVNMHANQLVSNFQIAANPQIVKKYAVKDYEGSKRLLLQTTQYSYYLMFLLALPICIAAEPLLRLWLGVVPEYTVVFLQLIIIQSLFQVFDTSFYRALYAKGQLRENALISPTIGFLCFPVVYILFKMGYPPVTLSWASLVMYAVLGLIVKPILIIRIVNYTWRDIFSVFIPCLKVTLAALPIPLIVNNFLDNYSLLTGFILKVLISIASVVCASWFLGIPSSQRVILVNHLKVKFQRGN